MANNIVEFDSSIFDQLGYYVYRLVDPRDGSTFYVGKGKGNRVFAHVNDTLKNYHGVNYSVKGEDVISLKIKQIKEIHQAGLDVIHIIHRWGLKDESVAFEVEAALIDAYPGLTNIQSGHGNDRGVVNSVVLNNALMRTEYMEPDFDYMIIKINRQVLNNRNGDIYETVRSAWKVSKEKREKYKYVLAVLDGVVVGVYEPSKWQSDSRGVAGRYEFIGTEAPYKIKNIFIDKKLPSKYRRKGMASPVLYSTK